MKRFKYAALIILFASAPAMASEDSVVQKDQTFSPGALTISAGDTVHWGNADDVTHNISVRGEGEDTDLGLQKRGMILSHTFGKKGVYLVICKIHPRMKMTVTVQ
jgi:plastocyanin